MANQNCRWFVEPHDDFTNESIARELSRLGNGEDECLSVQQEADDKTTHNVWEVPDHKFVAQLYNSQQPFKFAVFTLRDRGKLRRWMFEKRKLNKRILVSKSRQ